MSAGDAGSAALRRALPVLALVLLTLFAYSNSLGGPFVFDDFHNIRDNAAIRDLGSFLGPAGYRLQPNRFVGFATFALNHAVGGLRPAGYHAVNLAIHVTNALLVFALVLLALRAPALSTSRLVPLGTPLAFTAAAIFATHPLGTQAVTYVVQRLTSLATLFYLASVTLYLAWRLRREATGRGGALRYLGVLVLALLALRTKEIAFTLPAVLVLVELTLFPGAGWRRFLAVVPVAALALLVPLSLVDLHSAPLASLGAAEGVTRLKTGMGRLDYLRTQVVVVVEYLRLLAWPTGQSLDHDVPLERSFLAPHVLLRAALLLGLAALATALALRSAPGSRSRPLDPAWRLVALGIAWFLVTVLVESSVIPIVDLMYEHRAYLPSVGALVAASTTLALALQRLAPASAGRVLSLTGLGMALLLASATLARNAVWQSDVALWADAASKAPGKFRTVLNLGSALVAAGRLDEGAAVLRRAVELDPSSGTARVALGAALHRAGRAAEAEASYREALRLAPDDAQARFNLAELLWSQGRRAEAVPLYRQFLERTGPAESAVRGVAKARLGAAGAAGGSPPLPEERRAP